MHKLFALITALVLIAALAGAQAIAPQPKPRSQAAATTTPAKPSAAPAASKSNSGAGLPSRAEIDAAMQRSFGYDPAVTWNILDIRESPLPGVADVLVSMNRQNPVHVYVSPDGQNAIIGEIIPFGPNPFASARNKLKAADGPARGPASPAISMVEFSDLQCPHCKVAQPVMEKLAADFPQTRYVFQQFPLPATLHPWAMKAAEYADCAGQMDPQAFWKFIDSVFENQGGIALATADGKLKEIAAAVGLDSEKVAACAATPQAEARVKKSMELGQSLDVNETPTVFINGRRVSGIGNIPYEQLKTLVQFEIDHAGK